jgi:hypothetical protein
MKSKSIRQNNFGQNDFQMILTLMILTSKNPWPAAGQALP